MISAALAHAKTARDVCRAFELCRSFEDVDEFVKAYSATCDDPAFAVPNLRFGLNYFDATERAQKLFKVWDEEVRGEA